MLNSVTSTYFSGVQKQCKLASNIRYCLRNQTQNDIKLKFCTPNFALNCRNLTTNLSKNQGKLQKDVEKTTTSIKNLTGKKKIFVDTRVSSSGHAIIGVPRKSVSDVFHGVPNSQRFRQLTNQEQTKITPSIFLKYVKKYTGMIGGLVTRFGRSTAKVLWTAVTNPRQFIAWTRDVWKSFVHELKHYWTGFRLMGVELRTSVKLLNKTLYGYELTRRERKQLVRTTVDVMRLIPFSIFIIVPFMEFALPFAVRIFPGLLPSTFQSKYEREENMKKQFNLRLEIAGYLGDMVKTSAARATVKNEDADGNHRVSYADLEQFITQAKLGESLNKDDVYKVTKLFSDEITIGNMSRPELVLLCRYMGLTPYGGDHWLRFQLRRRINRIRHDDKLIQYEGVDSLNLLELQQACEERGMRATGLTKDQLKTQLKQWLDLSINKKVSASLLILSRAFIINDAGDEERYSTAIGEAIGTLDSEVTKVALAENVASLEGLPANTVTLNKKLEAVQFENQLLEDEVKTKRSETSEAVTDHALIEQLKLLSSDSAMNEEKKKIEALKFKQEDLDANEALNTGRITKHMSTDDDTNQSISGESDQEDSSKDLTTQRLSKVFERMVSKLETDLDKAGESIGKKMKVLDLDGDGRISRHELRKGLESTFKKQLSDEQIEKVFKTCDLDGDGTITVEDLDKVLATLEENLMKKE